MRAARVGFLISSSIRDVVKTKKKHQGKNGLHFEENDTNVSAQLEQSPTTNKSGPT
jgi:hypothetical protein